MASLRMGCFKSASMRFGDAEILVEGGQEPEGNPQCGVLFDRSGNRMMAVVVDTDEAGFPAQTPEMLFEGTYLPTAGRFP